MYMYKILFQLQNRYATTRREVTYEFDRENDMFSAFIQTRSRNKTSLLLVVVKEQRGLALVLVRRRLLLDRLNDNGELLVVIEVDLLVLVDVGGSSPASSAGLFDAVNEGEDESALQACSASHRSVN